jgi:hypothetical protein
LNPGLPYLRTHFPLTYQLKRDLLGPLVFCVIHIVVASYLMLAYPLGLNEYTGLLPVP